MLPTINVTNGQVSGTIHSRSEFEWINPTNRSCVVTDVGSWCTQNTYNVPPAISPKSPGRCMATTLNVTGDFSFACPCFTLPEVPHIHVVA